jgi:uncharacterized protein YkwD
MIRQLLTTLVLCTSIAGCSSSESATNTPSPDTSVTAQAGDVGTRLNAVRAQRGLGQLTRSGALERAASAHANDMSRMGYFSHTSPAGGTLVDRVRAAGYPYCFVAENIAQGQQSAAEVMSSWMNSAGHRRNNLSERATEFGVARAAGNYWVLVLGARC